MYQGDGESEGRKWVDTCYPTWRLNPANYYAPINEPGRNDLVGLKWLCDFYLGCMYRADEINIKMCIGEWSTGMPPLDTQSIAVYLPMLRYAKAHGHVLGLHEYSLNGPMIGNPLCLRYRQFYNALPADARTKIYITEAGPDAGYDTGYKGQAYVDVVGAYDLEVMKDSYVGGVALFKLGSGESNMSDVMPLLTDWVVAHPTRIDKEDVPMAFVFGVHSPASPGDLAASDMAGIQRASKFNGYKFLAGDSPTHYQQVFSLGIPPDNCMTRLFIDLSNQPKPTPAQFCDWMSLAIDEAMAVGVKWFEIHNEPNLTNEWPYSTDPHDFINWILQVIALLRTQHSGIKLVSPGLSPQTNTPQWWIEFGEHGVFDACDAIGAHVYWPNRATMLTQEQGLNFIPLLPASSATKPIFITEYANNVADDADLEKGLQYVDWASYIKNNYPTVTRTYIYVISSGTAVENTSRQTIVRGGIVSAIADGIRDGVFTEPDREFDHWEDLDTGANLGTVNPLTITVLSNRNIKAITRPKSTTYTVSVTTDGYGTVTGGGTYTSGTAAILKWSIT